jgi:protein FAM50
LHALSSRSIDCEYFFHRTKKKEVKIQRSKLSFADEFEDEEGQEGEEEQVEPKSNGKDNSSSGDDQKEKKSDTGTVKFKKPRMVKNPEVETSFLPDRDREEWERQQREELAKQWKEEQERIKSMFIDWWC